MKKKKELNYENMYQLILGTGKEINSHTDDVVGTAGKQLEDRIIATGDKLAEVINDHTNNVVGTAGKQLEERIYATGDKVAEVVSSNADKTTKTIKTHIDKAAEEIKEEVNSDSSIGGLVLFLGAIFGIVAGFVAYIVMIHQAANGDPMFVATDGTVYETMIKMLTVCIGLLACFVFIFIGSNIQKNR